MSSDACKNLLERHRDPAVKHLITDTLKVAQETGASKKVIESIEKAINLCWGRLQHEEDSTTADSETCKNIREFTFKNDWTKTHEEGKTLWDIGTEQMSNRTESQFFKSFVSATKSKQILEVGMYTGYTGTSMAEALPADGKITCLDQDEYLKTTVRSMTEKSPHKHKMDIIIGAALDTMKKMIKEGKKFDIVFLDAEESEFPEYVRMCFQDNLLAPNGTCIIDNAFMYGEAYEDPDSMTIKLARILMADQSLHVVLVPIKDGIFLVRRRSEVDGGVV